MDKALIFTILGVVIIGLLFWGAQSGFLANLFKSPVRPAVLPEGIVLFYGADCPHCKIVEDFLVQNKISEKVKYSNLEVPFNGKTSPELEANAMAALEKAQVCKIDFSKGLSIPFLWDGKGNCLEGDQPVINFFKNEAGIK